MRCWGQFYNVVWKKAVSGAGSRPCMVDGVAPKRGAGESGSGQPGERQGDHDPGEDSERKRGNSTVSHSAGIAPGVARWRRQALKEGETVRKAEATRDRAASPAGNKKQSSGETVNGQVESVSMWSGADRRAWGKRSLHRPGAWRSASKCPLRKVARVARGLREGWCPRVRRVRLQGPMHGDRS
jgi:hypothetical protein